MKTTIFDFFISNPKISVDLSYPKLQILVHDNILALYNYLF